MRCHNDVCPDDVAFGDGNAASLIDVNVGAASGGAWRLTTRVHGCPVELTGSEVEEQARSQFLNPASGGRVPSARSGNFAHGFGGRPLRPSPERESLKSNDHRHRACSAVRTPRARSRYYGASLNGLANRVGSPHSITLIHDPASSHAFTLYQPEQLE